MNGILGLGVDIVSHKRIEKVYSRFGDKFAKKILSDSEYSIYKIKSDKVKFLAKSFSVKEAVLKSIKRGMNGTVSLKDIQISNDSNGCPKVEILTLPYMYFIMSLSDDDGFTVSTVIRTK